MKNPDKMTWRRAFLANRHAIGLLYRTNPQILLSSIASAVWEALTPYVGIYLSARIIEALSAGADSRTVWNLIWITLASAALIALGTAFLNKWVNTYCNFSSRWFAMEQLYTNKLMDMDFVDADATETQDLLSTIHQNDNGGGWGIKRIVVDLNNLVCAVLTALGGVALTVSLFTSRVPETAGEYTVLNSGAVCAAVIAAMLAVTFLAPMLETKAGSYWAKYANMHNFSNRMFRFTARGMLKQELATDIRIYRQEFINRIYLKDKTDCFASKGFFAKLAREKMGPLSAASAAVSVIFTGLAYGFVCLKAWAGAFGVGMVTQYISSITKVGSGVSRLFSVLGDMRNNAAFLEVAFSFLDIPNNMYQGSLTVEKRRDCDYEVEFRDVSFRYPGAANYALAHVNMKFKVGKRLAVVGMNGSGKTTFIKLLCRLYDPTEGEILLNGINIRKYNYQDYMGIFSVVFQDFKLLSLPLDENVASGKDVDESRVVDCLKKAGFGDRLAQLKDGIHTYLYKDFENDGINVSGGEAQKIAIARAIYKDAPFIILDEPTAALDPVAESEIYTEFDKISGEKTAVYISHRLSSCKFCDEIAVFDHGSVVQMGTHADLVADASGKYYELWNAQAQYYTEQKESK